MVAPPKPTRNTRAASRRPSADLETLAQLGLGNPPREPRLPAPRAPRAPRRPPAPPVPATPQPIPKHADALRAALTAGGYTIAGIDERAVKVLAALDRWAVDRIVLWIQHQPGADPPPNT